MPAVDEMMVAFKGRHKLKVYMPRKPTNWGYKIWSLAGASVYVYNFEIVGDHDRKGALVGERAVKVIGKSWYVVARLTQSLGGGKNKVNFDSCFASPNLLVYLKKMCIFALSTLRPTRRCGCSVSSEKDMKREGLGAIDDIVNLVIGVVICTWYGNTASNFIAKEPIGNFSRYEKKERKCIELTRPASIETYNQYMGAVNKAAMMLSLYKKKCRT